MKDELKKLLANTLVRWIHNQGLNQKQASKVLGVTQPRVSNLMLGHLEKFSVDSLLELMSYAGCTHEMTSIDGVVSVTISPIREVS